MSRARVLLVDDEEDLRVSTAQALELHDLDVETFSAADDVLARVGPGFAGVLWSEGFFRHFDNRRQLAAYAGLAPTPWQSGTINHEQGVSKAGNPRLRAILVEMAWLWLRHQPGSALARWYHERVQRSGGRLWTR